jgi:hypothetical protein
VTPVYQTDDKCFAACIASLFHMSLEEVPKIDVRDSMFWGVWRAWFLQRNLDMEWRKFCKPDCDDCRDVKIPKIGYCLVDFYNRPELDEADCHVVVYHNGRLAHDPRRGTYVEGWPAGIRGVYTFRVVDPWKMVANV